MQNKKPDLLNRAKLKGVLFDLLARRDYSRHELMQKLSPRAENLSDLIALLDELAEMGLQSDQRFSESFVRSRSQRYGPLRLKQALRQKGIEATQLNQALDEAEMDWQAQAHTLIQQRFPTFDRQDIKQKAKVYRFLAQRGFSSDQIHAALARVGVDIWEE